MLVTALVVSSLVLQVPPSHHLFLHQLKIQEMLQVLLGLLFLILGGLDINEDEHQKSANILNNTATVVVFIITLINAIISGFGVQHTDTKVFNRIESLKVT